MYGKLFASLYQGTLRGQSHPILVFTNLLAHADQHGHVDKHFRAIADEVGLTVDEVKAAIAILESPDEESRNPDYAGARLIRLDEHRMWGWLIVSYAKYRAIRNEDDRRTANREAQRRWRDKQRKYCVSTDKQDKPKEKQKESSEAGDSVGAKAPTCPSEPDMIERIWPDYPKKGRERSTRAKARAAWQRIPKGKRPEPETILDALRGWKKCDEWNRDHGAYVPGLHIWIKAEAYLDPPHEIRRTNPADLPSWAK